MIFLQQSLKAVFYDYTEIFKKRFPEGLSIPKSADALRMKCGAVERRQNALYLAFASLLRQRDEAGGICRLSQENDEDYLNTTKKQQLSGIACHADRRFFLLFFHGNRETNRLNLSVG